MEIGMKNFRGRPRNISESGVIYLDSDGEDSDISDSDVEPVFFPAAGFDFNAEVFEVQGGFPPFSDDEDSDDSLFQEVTVRRPVNVVAPMPAVVNADADSDNQVIIQFVGGTVQVRHIVNEEFAQLQQQLNEGEQPPPPEGEEVVPPSPSIVPGNQGEILEEERQIYVVDFPENQPVPPVEPPVEIMENQNGEIQGQQNLTEQSDHMEALRGSDGFTGIVSLSLEQLAGSSSARLVPYAEDDDNNSQQNTNHDADNRKSLKRKDPDPDSSADEEDKAEYPDPQGVSHQRKALKNAEASDEDEEEETCNPMVSEDEEETETAFRGDRIGTTMYSESHVLRILMKWVEALPSHSDEKLVAARDEGISEEVLEKDILRLSNDLEEQMALLWDMSAEADVMNFLVENKVFALIRNTIDNCVCNRLIEVALGILANVISEPSIIEDFTVHDSSLQIVEKVIELCSKVTDVAVLIQAFSVLRRIVWYLRNVGTMKKWTDLLLSARFLECSSFIMSSSRNVLLLGNVIMLFFTLLDSLNPDGDEYDEENGDLDQSSEDNQLSSSDSQKQAKVAHLTKNYESFCKSDFVPALCEGLKELMKNPTPPKGRRKLTSTHEKQNVPSTSACQTDEHCPNADDIDIPIPEGHVQQAILKGFSTLALLQKAPNGQNALKTQAPGVIEALLDFYRTFSKCTEAITRSNSLEYFALSLHLLSFCHSRLDSVNTEAILHPVSTASKLMNQEERDKEVDMIIRVQLKDGVEFDSVSYIALVVHEYLATVADRFGPDCTLKARANASHAKFFAILDKVVAKFTEEPETKEIVEEGEAH